MSGAGADQGKFESSIALPSCWEGLHFVFALSKAYNGEALL